MIQKIRSDVVISYNIFGLNILIIFCELFVIISIIIESFFEWRNKKFRKKNYQQFEWMSNNILQLQKFVHEKLNCETWVEKNIFITAVDETFAVLDIFESDHSRLINSASSHVFVVMINVFSFVMANALLFTVNVFSFTANVSVTTIDIFLFLMNVFSSLTDFFSSTADVFLFIEKKFSFLMNIFLFLADPSSFLLNISSFMTDASLFMMKEVSSSAAVFLNIIFSSQESSDAPILDTRHWCIWYYENST